MTTKPSVDRFRRATAQRLRLNSRRLWRHLRQLPTFGSHFRRQVPIGPYVADFACLAARLIIEVDGSQHGVAKNQLHDDARTRSFESEGYRVLRVWNNEVTQKINGVMESIYAAVHGSIAAEPNVLKHRRHQRAQVTNHPPRRASRADPPPPGEGNERTHARLTA